MVAKILLSVWQSTNCHALFPFRSILGYYNRVNKSNYFSFIMQNKIEKYSASELDTIRNFFTDEQWDVIDYALSEYQDHEDYTDLCRDTLNRLGDLFQSQFTTNGGAK